MASAASRDQGTALEQVLAGLTPRQSQRLRGWQGELERAQGWSTALPVVLLERCWLRLQAVPLIELPRVLPADASAEAPELVRYRELRAAGLSSWDAEQRCWLEFGSAACQEALRRLWTQQERDPQGWTLSHYLALLASYRRQMEGAGPRQLPLLVLARAGSREPHRLWWLQGEGQSMRHTCA